MSSPFRIRPASVRDAADLLAIYRPFVEETTVSFEIEVPGLAEFEQRIDTALRGWGWLVAEVDGRPVGYAYGSSHRARDAYRYSVETSAYVREDHRRRGMARALYTQLFTALGDRGFASLRRRCHAERGKHRFSSWSGVSADRGVPTCRQEVRGLA